MPTVNLAAKYDKKMLDAVASLDGVPKVQFANTNYLSKTATEHVFTREEV